MSPLLRRLGVTRRRSRADLERALEVAETDRDIARAEKASAYEALGKVAAAAGRPGAPTRWNVEDLVQWVAAAAASLTRAREDTRRAEGHAKRNVDRLRQLPRDIEHIVQWCRAIGVKATRQPQLLSDAEALAATAPRIAEELSRALTGEPLEYAGPPSVEVEAADPWCSADLDGARCARPAGHTEPCRPVEPAPVGPQVAQCLAIGFWGERCALFTGHPHAHSWGCTS